jgi:hypothetical protein
LQRWLASVSTRAQPRAVASGLDSVTEPVLRARRSDVLHAVLDIVPLARALDVLDAAGDRLQLFFLTELPARWNDSDDGRRGDAAVAVAFVTSESPSLPEWLIDQILTRLAEWIRSAPIERLDRVERLLKDADPEVSQDWRQAIADIRPTMRRTESARTPQTPGRWFGLRRGGT